MLLRIKALRILRIDTCLLQGVNLNADGTPPQPSPPPHNPPTLLLSGGLTLASILVSLALSFTYEFKYFLSFLLTNDQPFTARNNAS